MKHTIQDSRQGAPFASSQDSTSHLTPIKQRRKTVDTLHHIFKDTCVEQEMSVEQSLNIHDNDSQTMLSYMVYIYIIWQRHSEQANVVEPKIDICASEAGGQNHRITSTAKTQKTEHAMKGD
jgi:hypothetical protein